MTQPSPGVPRFRLPWPIAPGLGMSVVTGSPRNLAADCRAMVARMRPVPRVIGVRNVPDKGPFVLVANHFEEPGIWIGWTAALLTHAVARARPAWREHGDPTTPIHWLVVAEVDRSRVDGWKKRLPGTGWAFRRVAKVWGMAAIERFEAPAGRRIGALRRLVRLASPPPHGAGEPVGFFPEGEGDGFDGLRPVPDAAGTLLALLGRRGVPAVPAAVWLEVESGTEGIGRLTARIGPAWMPAQSGTAGAREAMAQIGQMLPERMWGVYRDAIAARSGNG